jgi:hypothetical protein
MFRALPAHFQEALHSQLVDCVRVSRSQPTDKLPTAVCEAPPEDEQVVLETCRGRQFIIN